VATYEVVTLNRAGATRTHRYASDEPLGPGDIVRLDGRDWLIERTETTGGEDAPRLVAKPGRYRLRLRHPEGRVETGAFRRLGPGAPRYGHVFTTVEDGQPVSWQIVEERLEHDEDGEPYLELVAERDYSEFESVPDHELEHATADEETSAAVAAALDQAAQAGLAAELVALDPGEEPDWAEAERYLEALTLDEVEDDLLELSGVRPDRDPQETWLDTVKQRLRSDLESFRTDVEDAHDQIEEWDFLDGRVFASVGSVDDEADPNSGHGWLCRLVDSGALAAAGFQRVLKAQL
jgi:hypothetical protein